MLFESVTGLLCEMSYNKDALLVFEKNFSSKDVILTIILTVTEYPILYVRCLLYILHTVYTVPQSKNTVCAF